MKTQFPVVKNIEALFKSNGIDYSWASIQVGWKLKLILYPEIEKFVLSYLEKHPTLVDLNVIALIDTDPRADIDSLLQKAFMALKLEFPEKNSRIWNKEWRKWRLCCLVELEKHSQDDEQLLIEIEGIYADFGYPEDMRSFIYYLPADEEAEIIENEGLERARKRIVGKFLSFLKNEKR